ncbi:hypothetical protein K373_05840 [Streptomyces sp. DvalAA-21]|nr:hypothetical protein K373_05840 [Streptomyces sp. DvalAA-21]RAJ28518.1 hypothetical protein K351_05772 [Streptomyces sp. DpondAA-E10]RAJ42150.1 hypothetical protein K352_05763 [Streptomyces sp. DpondAA-A50]SCE49355.1 hypothetical protein GA0115235_121716 [Streptomyces sp. DpondAA-F4a]SCM01292.1 hypothetical protein SAMN04883147_1052275 [Streptomyces sp. DpondAA-F4]
MSSGGPTAARTAFALCLAVHSVDIGFRFIHGVEVTACPAAQGRLPGQTPPTHTTRSAADAGRLLPWTTLEGRSCYVMGGATGCISRVADTVEGLVLDMAAELLAHAADLLADHRASSV